MLTMGMGTNKTVLFWRKEKRYLRIDNRIMNYQDFIKNSEYFWLTFTCGCTSVEIFITLLWYQYENTANFLWYYSEITVYNERYGENIAILLVDYC